MQHKLVSNVNNLGEMLEVSISNLDMIKQTKAIKHNKDMIFNLLRKCRLTKQISKSKCMAILRVVVTLNPVINTETVNKNNRTND